MTKSRNINRPKWRPSEVDIERVRSEFANTLTADLAKALGVEYHQVVKLAKRLGIKKSAEFLGGSDSGRLDGVRGSSSRFQPGQKPWNTGMKGLQTAPVASRFKPGQKPLNWLPVGSFRVMSAESGSYLQIKLTDTGYPPRDWVMYHRHVWEQAHGPIPEGHMVVFKGPHTTDPEQITPDILECISRVEHMKRHTFHQYGPEIAGCVLLRSAITRQINRRVKEAQES
jgi:hypothetical protein